MSIASVEALDSASFKLHPGKLSTVKSIIFFHKIFHLFYLAYAISPNSSYIQNAKQPIKICFQSWGKVIAAVLFFKFLKAFSVTNDLSNHYLQKFSTYISLHFLLSLD